MIKSRLSTILLLSNYPLYSHASNPILDTNYQTITKLFSAYNAIMIFEYMDGHSSHSPWLNHGYKIECQENAPHWQSLESKCQCKTKTLILAAMI